MGNHSKQVSTFQFEGRFLGFELADGYKRKYLRLATAEGECSVKLCKQLRRSFELRLIPGDWVEVSGEQQFEPKKGKLKLKAERVVPATPSQDKTKVPATTPPAKSKKQASILVCQKSSCMKRGGKAVCQALAETLEQHGLADEVAIKGTGCLKQCKAGPNLVMPDKTRYSRIQAEQIPAVIAQHFDPEVKEPEAKPQEEVATVNAESLATA